MFVRWLAIMLAAATSQGCCTVRFRVPLSEVQRLADLPSTDRGRMVRVVPWATPPTPSDPTPRPLAVVVPALPVTARPSTAGSFRGVQVARPVGYAAPPKAHSRSSDGGPHLGGLFGSRGAEVVAAVVVVVIAVAAIATVVDAEAKDTAFARDFDGWVTVSPWQKLHLQHSSGAVREIPLAELTPSDVVGVRYAHLSDVDGSVSLLGRVSAFGQHPERQPPAPRSPAPLPPNAPAPESAAEP